MAEAAARVAQSVVVSPPACNVAGLGGALERRRLDACRHQVDEDGANVNSGVNVAVPMLDYIIFAF